MNLKKIYEDQAMSLIPLKDKIELLYADASINKEQYLKIKHLYNAGAINNIFVEKREQENIIRINLLSIEFINKV